MIKLTKIMIKLRELVEKEDKSDLQRRMEQIKLTYFIVRTYFFKTVLTFVKQLYLIVSEHD